jgi:hypothetical protein
MGTLIIFTLTLALLIYLYEQECLSVRTDIFASISEDIIRILHLRSCELLFLLQQMKCATN